jgi:cysteinyl-tRNA synthetase
MFLFLASFIVFGYKNNYLFFSIITFRRARALRAIDAAQFKARFVEAMDDDFNAPQAVAVMFDLVREINRGAEKEMDVSAAQAMLQELAGVIGFTLKEASVDQSKAAMIEDKIRQRNEFRKAKEWKKADEIRDELLKQGVAIEDGPKGDDLEGRQINKNFC